MLSFNFDAQAGESPASVAQKRALIAQLMGAQRTPSNLGEGFSALGDGIVANVEGGRARDAEAAGQASANDTFGALTSMLTGQGGATPTAGSAGGPNAYRDAIASIESAGSGDYGAIGPTNDRLGRALGRYQVMEANIGPWSREALGREVTPEEFLANPDLQDAIFDHKFNGYVNQFGPEGAAQAWFAGPGGVGKMDRSDVLGTSVSAYTDKFNSALGGAGQPTQVASLDPTIGAPQPQPAQLPPMQPPQMAQPAPMSAPAPQQAPQAPVQTAQGPSLQMLMEAAANPWLNDSQKGIINSMIAQQMQQQDPAYQQGLRAGDLGIQKSELELEALRNPQPDPGFRQLSPQEVQSSGLDPKKAYQVGPDGKIAEIGGGGVTVNTGNMGEIGSIPPDYELITDPVTGARSMQIIPGSPSDRKAQADAAAAASQAGATQDQTSRYGNVVVEDIDRALGVLSNDPTWSTGILGQAMGNFKGSSSDRLNNLLDTVRANSAFDRLQAMRDASPTGGALGAVSERELGLLQSAIGSLETGNADDLAYNLKRLQTIYSEIIDGPKSAAPNQSQAGQPPAGVDQSVWAVMTPEERALWQ